MRRTMESLPPEMIREVLQYLEPESLLQVKQVSKRMKDTASRVFWSRYRREILLPHMDTLRQDIEIVTAAKDGEDDMGILLYYFETSMHRLRDVFHHWGRGRKPPLSTDPNHYPSDFDEWDVRSFHKSEGIDF